MEGNAIVSTCLSELGYAELVTICRIRQLSKEPDHSPCSCTGTTGKVEAVEVATTHKVP